MNWIETIHLRSGNLEADQNIEKLYRQIKIQHQEKPNLIMKYYKDISILTDHVILFQWHDQHRPPQKSIPGIKLAQSLRQLGLVNHTLFVEKG